MLVSSIITYAFTTNPSMALLSSAIIVYSNYNAKIC